MITRGHRLTLNINIRNKLLRHFSNTSSIPDHLNRSISTCTKHHERCSDTLHLAVCFLVRFRQQKDLVRVWKTLWFELKSLHYCCNFSYKHNFTVASHWTLNSGSVEASCLCDSSLPSLNLMVKKVSKVC